MNHNISTRYLSKSLFLIFVLSLSLKVYSQVDEMPSADEKFKGFDFDGAIEDYSKIIDNNSKNTEAYLKRGISYYYITSYTKSIVDLTKVMIYKSDKTNREKAFFYRGLARLATKQYRSALSDFEEAVERNPTYYEAMRYRGIARIHLNMEGALSDLDTSIEHSPKTGQYYLDLVQDIKKTKTKNSEILAKSEQWNETARKLFNISASADLSKNKLEEVKKREAPLNKDKTNKVVINKIEKPKINKPLEKVKKIDDSKGETEDVDFVLKIMRPQIWAVIIGISSYKNDKINLRYASKDATDFYNFLKSNEGGKVPDSNIKLLTNQDATRKNILKSLNENFSKANENDVVIFYVASHGQSDPVGGQVYFLNYEANLKELAGTAIAHSEIERAFRQTKANKKLWIADACHSGATSGLSPVFNKSENSNEKNNVPSKIKMIDKNKAKELVENELTNQLLDEMSLANPSTALLMASSSQEFSFEDIKWGNGHGVFTFYLLEGLNGKADINKDKIVNIRELYNYVYNAVSGETSEQQHPELKGSFDNRLPISIISDKN